MRESGPSLRAQVLHSLKWTAATRFLGQVVSWAITLLVMRLLSPADYGLLALATIFTGFLHLLNEIGLSSSIVQAEKLELRHLRQAFGAILVVNVAICVAIALVLAPAAAAFFDEPQLEPVMQFLGLTFLPIAFSVIPAALLEREMRFRERSIAEFAAMLATSFLVLWLAYHGFGVWSLVLGNMLQLGLRAAILNYMHPFLHMPTFSFARAGTLFSVGRDVFAARLLWFFYSQADAFIAGKLLGKQALGLYSVAMHIAALPVERISVVLNQVALAAFSKSSREEGQVGYLLLKSARAMSFVAFPVLWGISSVSPELVKAILGATWEPAIPMLALLCLVMPLRMLGEVMKSALQSVGRADTAVRNTLYAAVVMPAAFYFGCRFGLIGLALAWVLVYPLVFLKNVADSAPHLGLKAGALLAAMARPALISAAMYAAVAAARPLIAAPPLAALGWLVAVGMVVYAALSLVANRGVVDEVRDLLTAQDR